MGSYNPVKKYQAVQVESASPEALVVIAYDGLLKLLYTAKSRMAEKKIEPTHEALKKAQMVIIELMGALRVDVWPGAVKLMGLYQFILRRLQEANMKKTPEPIDEVLPIVNELRNAWQQAYREVQAQKAPKSVIGSRR